ncbi:hypothetical protein K443DRAFT_130973 [Laccaria amethystina LaAM-08-1]|uniref:Uncharacterized protein n=1 Tax=Laccaria amethystina LaAM-08-1 TaxID=1095629 RepID=A0A0C9Y251_9AGAR|nr:hypothetical protein K443DRAFT_130973 [Laccaria amethystina LaAM-08-1]
MFASILSSSQSLSLLWLDALRNFNSEWEVSWAPTVCRTDKQMWVRFPEVCEDQESMIMKFKSPVCSSFAMKTGAGGIILTLVCHKHVEGIMKLGRVNIPGVLHPLTPQHGRQIEIENTFELAIMGLTDEIDSVEAILERWLTETFVVDGELTFAGIWSSPDASEALIFHMTMWEAATKVLSSTTAELFNQTFGRKYPTLVAPQSVYAINHKGLWRNKTICETFAKGSESMTENFKTLQQQINMLKAETKQGIIRKTTFILGQTCLEEVIFLMMQAMQLEMSTINFNLASVTTAVLSLQSSVDNAHLALLAQSTEISLSRNLAEVQTARFMLHSQLVMTNDPKERGEAESIINMLDTQEREIHTKLDTANCDFQTLIGGPVGQLMPPLSTPPGLPPCILKSVAHVDNEQPQQSSVKWQRTMSEPAEEQVVAANLTAEDGMVVEDAAPATEVSQGRAVVIDVVLSTLNGGCAGHRIIGAYAPWNLGGSGDVRHFWNDIAQLCLSSPTSWTMVGDFNVTVSSLERISGVDFKLGLVLVQSTIKAVCSSITHQGPSEVGKG